MIDFGIESFVRRYMTKRAESLLAADFDKWLKNNKYSNKLHCGTMTIKKGLTYEELAKELTTQGR